MLGPFLPFPLLTNSPNQPCPNLPPSPLRTQRERVMVQRSAGNVTSYADRRRKEEVSHAMNIRRRETGEGEERGKKRDLNGV